MYVGIDIGGTKMLLVAYEHLANGDSLEALEPIQAIQATMPTGPQFDSRTAEAAIARFIAQLPAAPCTIGIAVPGLVTTGHAEAGDRVLSCDALLGLDSWTPAKQFARETCQVTVLNDIEAALTAEKIHFAPHSQAAVVMVGTAVGAAFLVNGQLMRGAQGWAGELGYLPVVLSDGRRGRLDEAAGGSFIAATLGLDGAGLAQAAQAGNERVLEAIAQGGESFGLGLAAVINLFNPLYLSIGGGTWNLPGYRAAALHSAQRFALPDLWAGCNIRDVKAGKQVVALGAAIAANNQRYKEICEESL